MALENSRLLFTQQLYFTNIEISRFATMQMQMGTLGRTPAALPTQSKSSLHLAAGPQRPVRAAARQQRSEKGMQ